MRGKNAGSCEGCRRELRNKFEFFAAAVVVVVAAEMAAEERCGVKILANVRQLDEQPTNNLAPVKDIAITFRQVQVFSFANA